MPPELEPVDGLEEMPTSGRSLVRCGADVVYLAEELFVRLFVLTVLLTIVGCGLSIWFAQLAPPRPTGVLIWVFAVAGIGLAAAGLARPRQAYCWLRYSESRQLAIAALAMIAVLTTGPDSPSWWVAMPLLWILCAVSATRVAVGAATVTALAYLGGTVISGEAFIQNGDAGVLAAAVALPANTLVGRLIAEVFTGFVLQLHRLETPAVEPAPVRLPNLAATPAAGTTRPRQDREQASQPERLSRLTTRQLEVALLARDGLLRSEIALCLGISSRQVERLLYDARVRVGAANANELIAMLVTGRLAPAP